MNPIQMSNQARFTPVTIQTRSTRSKNSIKPSGSEQCEINSAIALLSSSSSSSSSSKRKRYEPIKIRSWSSTEKNLLQQIVANYNQEHPQNLAYMNPLINSKDQKKAFDIISTEYQKEATLKGFKDRSVAAIQAYWQYNGSPYAITGSLKKGSNHAITILTLYEKEKTKSSRFLPIIERKFCAMNGGYYYCANKISKFIRDFQKESLSPFNLSSTTTETRSSIDPSTDIDYGSDIEDLTDSLYDADDTDWITEVPTECFEEEEENIDWGSDAEDLANSLCDALENSEKKAHLSTFAFADDTD